MGTICLMRHIAPPLALALVPSLLAGQVRSEPCSALCLSERARTALAAGHSADFLTYARQLAGRAPDHAGVIYAVASGFALVGQADSALARLDRLARIGASRAAASDSTFVALWKSPTFLAIQTRLDANRVPIINGKAAFQLLDPDFLPEALAWDGVSGSWLAGSLSKRKVIRVRPDGSTTDFISAPDLLRVV